MIKGSSKLFDYALKSSEKIKDCITDYIKYIVTLTSATGLISFLVNKDISSINRLFIIVFVLVGITLFFEIIWYKFKSNNRYEGLNDLLSEENDCIEYTTLAEKEKEDEFYIIEKKYIVEYSDLISKKDCTFQEDISSFNLYISRHNDSMLHKYNYNSELKRDTTIKSVSKSKYVFSVPEEYIRFIEVNKYDTSFFKKIIWELYGDRIYPKNKFKILKILVKDFFKSLGFIFFRNSRFIRILNIDKRYISSGWKYPKKITQIAYLSILLISSMFFYFINLNYHFDYSIHFSKASPLPLILTVIFINAFWLLRYVNGLKEIIYGKHSIDGYCWTFFTYRVQDLNSNGIVPIYYSRSFIRFFKTNIYIKYLSGFFSLEKKERYKFDISNLKLSLMKETVKKEYNELKKNEVIKITENILKTKITNFEEHTKSFLTDKLINDYVTNLTEYKSFKRKERVLHKIIVTNFKQKMNFKLK